MKTISVDVVPELPIKDIICDECVAIGVIDSGILIHYMNQDVAKIVEWEDIVLLGMANDSQEIHTDDAKPIAAPAKQ